MFLEDVPPVVAGVGAEWIAPTITGIVSLLVLIFGALLARRGQKIGNRETRAPDVQEMWAQQEADRRIRQLVEDMWWTLRRMFQAYYRRVTTTAEALDLDPQTLKRFELTAAEKRAINAHLPDEDKGEPQ